MVHIVRILKWLPRGNGVAGAWPVCVLRSLVDGWESKHSLGYNDNRIAHSGHTLPAGVFARTVSAADRNYAPAVVVGSAVQLRTAFNGRLQSAPNSTGGIIAMLPKFAKWRDYAMFRSLSNFYILGPFTNATVAQILQNNERRLGFVIANCTNITGWCMPDGITPAAANGISLCAANLSFQPLVMNVWDHGSIVQRAWNAIIVTPGWKIAIIETLAGGEFLEDYPGSPGE
jgi:hypothetical protein